MDSRVFIKQAAALNRKIEDAQLLLSVSGDLQARRDDTQREINQLFAGLQNPTLPSAYKLRDVALRAGYDVDPRVLHRLAPFDCIL